MAISDFKAPLASDPEVQARALANIEREFQTRFIGDSEESARNYLKLIGITPSDRDVATAMAKRDRARYDELKEFGQPFEASRFAQKNPHVYAHGADRTNVALNMARARAIGSQTAAEAGNPFDRAAARIRGDK